MVKMSIKWQLRRKPVKGIGINLENRYLLKKTQGKEALRRNKQDSYLVILYILSAVVLGNGGR